MFDGDADAALEAQLVLFTQLTDPTRQRAVINLDDDAAEKVEKGEGCQSTRRL